MDRTKTTLAASVGVGIASLLLLLVLYGGAYLVLVRVRVYPSRAVGDPLSFATYYAGGQALGNWAGTLFGPAETIDRKLRPSMWPR